jgi:glycosyltransferase involved in cell wall biosynthesis
LRIFAVFFHPRADFTAVGGAEKRFLRVLKVWGGKGVDVSVVESSPALVSACCPSFETREIASPVSAYGKGLNSIYLEWVLWVVKACIRCSRILKEKRQDIILSPNNTPPNLIVAYFVHVLSRLPLVVTVHHFDFPNTGEKANLASAYRIYRDAGFGSNIALVKALTFSIMLVLVKRADRLITVSNYTARFLLKNDIPKDKIGVSGNGIDTDLIEQSAAEKKIYEGIFVGRISRDKGVFDLVQIWKLIVADKPDFRLVVVGNGPDVAKLKALIRQNGLSSNIILKGRCTDMNLFALMKASKVFLFPSKFEGWGLAIGEALACGLPVVCYDIPALREIFGDCRSVFFVGSNNTAGFARSCQDILSRDDLESLRTISEQYIRRFDWTEVAATDLQFIDQSVSTP